MPIPTYSMSGDCGDLIYALPCLRSVGPVHLVLFPDECTGYRMTEDRFQVLAPLLRVQPYLASVRWAPHAAGTNLDNWRRPYRGRSNISDMICDACQAPRPYHTEAWLERVTPRRVASVVLARNDRYRNERFPWKAVHAKYAHDAVFVGTPTEHKQFCVQVGPVPYHPTPDLLTAAEVLAGAELFVGNQSCPLALRLGLGTMVGSTVVEVFSAFDNCRWVRPGCYCGTDGSVYLPDLSGPESQVDCERNEVLSGV